MAEIVLDGAERRERCQEERRGVGVHDGRARARGLAARVRPWMGIAACVILDDGGWPRSPGKDRDGGEGSVDIRRPGDRWTANKILEKLEGIGPGNPRPTEGRGTEIEGGKVGGKMREEEERRRRGRIGVWSCCVRAVLLIAPNDCRSATDSVHFARPNRNATQGNFKRESFSNMPGGHQLERTAGPRRIPLISVVKTSDDHQPHQHRLAAPPKTKKTSGA
ncbi:hypothetical protein DFH06DRAFT_1129420 [Mycena polygramma]|nr:hypothetical protein DFH06DRAFT_1129420 [Mycena polygramma]